MEDAQVAVEAGADLLGFIFYEPSLRYVAPEQVRAIVTAAKQTAEEQRGKEASEKSITNELGDAPRPTSDLTCVGVFVNEAPETIRQMLDFCRLDAAQLHGEESPAEVASFAGIAYKALRPKSPDEAYSLVQHYAMNEQLTMNNEQSSHPPILPSSDFAQDRPSNLPTLLLDAYHPNLYGGTGRRVDWVTAAEIARRLRLMLAGSLTPENVVEAIRAVRPWGVDVSSGVEATKGKKDHGKVRAFVHNVKSKTQWNSIRRNDL